MRNNRIILCLCFLLFLAPSLCLALDEQVEDTRSAQRVVVDPRTGEIMPNPKGRDAILPREKLEQITPKKLVQKRGRAGGVVVEVGKTFHNAYEVRRDENGKVVRSCVENNQ